ncbi:penicillin-binding protein 2 [Candidatus Kaiserbacteria bacterium]|nr:penicillin-binding protein 2 [Candidatus Kaiserbacteria bacterium]
MAAKSRNRFAVRIRLIAGFMLLIAAAFIVRLYFLQIVHGADYRKEAESEYVKQSGNQVDRGSIFFTAKDGTLISAATVSSGDTIAVNPKTLADPEAAYVMLKKYIPDLDKSSFITKASNKNEVYVEAAQKATDETGKKITAENMTGIEVLKETWRSYPGNNLAAHEIGFLAFGPDGKTITGQYGLERFYDAALARSSGGLYVNFFADLFTNIRSQLFSDDTQSGADLVTSIEPNVQGFLQDAINGYDAAWHPKIAGGIIMDPSTGAIIAMASTPTFDPNDFKNTDVQTFTNPLVENVYEFGSTMKPLTMAAGIDAGAVTPETTYNDKGFAIFDGSKISNYDGKGRGVVPMQEVLNQSLNTGVAFVVSKMGTSAFRDYFERFGITEETGIDLPNEASPLAENFKSPRTIEYVTAAFGQGIALSPVAMTRALATLANHGAVPTPHVGVELDYGGGIVKKLGWSPPRQAISKESAETVTRMLVTVVDTALQHGKIKIPEYSVAAKTGTAQIARPDKRGYYDDRYLHSFFGYFPAYNPKFIIFFFATEPKGAQFASETWTGPFTDTVHFLINYYDIPPDRAPASR